MTDDLHAFYLNREEPHKSCLLALRDLLLTPAFQLSETRKYGIPCFTHGKKAVCYLWTDKQTGHPYILWVEGNQLTHTALKTGNRKRMKVLKVNPLQDLPVAIIEEILRQAVQLAGKRN